MLDAALRTPLHNAVAAAHRDVAQALLAPTLALALALAQTQTQAQPLALALALTATLAVALVL